MKTLLRTTAFFVFSVSLGMTASAHPGHGEPGAGHYLTSPEHVLSFALVALGVVVLGSLAWNRLLPAAKTQPRI